MLDAGDEPRPGRAEATDDRPVVIDVDGAWKSYRLYKEKATSLKERITKVRGDRYDLLWANKDINIQLRQGEVLGLIGHNGSGKSTLLRMMAGIQKPNQGTVAIDGRVSALLELGAGFHPDLTGRENVYLNASILGMRRARDRQGVRRHRRLRRRPDPRVHRHAGEDLLERDVRAPRLLGGRAPVAPDPHDRRDHRRGRRVVPAAVLRVPLQAALRGRDHRDGQPRHGDGLQHVRPGRVARPRRRSCATARRPTSCTAYLDNVNAAEERAPRRPAGEGGAGDRRRPHPGGGHRRPSSCST